MITQTEFDYAYYNMSEGQKQHMANRLYKRAGIYAQQLDARLVPEMPKPGDMFERVEPEGLFDGERYLLACFGGEDTVLVSLRSGNAWRNPRGPINGYDMTPEDWKSVCGDPQNWRKVPK